ncbi:hypothetical protein VNI00_010986 [Paramarasmius palmivorus]|uniref:C2H2-type domain-containing protein n=1 Tax=Paramarasmius palmivorus TaxID=297713 RepID=A0AAW0CI49_9AGAR
MAAFQCSQCSQVFTTLGGRTRHENTQHRPITPPPGDENANDEEREYQYERHPHFKVERCDELGVTLLHGSPPPKEPEPPPIDSPEAWAPFSSRVEFDFAHFHFVELQASRASIDKSLDIICAYLRQYGDDAPFANAEDLYGKIDEIQETNTLWRTYQLSYSSPKPDDPPKWMTDTYTVCLRNLRDVLSSQLSTKAFHSKFSYTPYKQYNSSKQRVFSNLMSGFWAWETADKLMNDSDTSESTRGAMLVPIIMGSDKTTVSVATGHQEFHPGYVSAGNLTNVACRGHGNSLLPFIFFPIPRTNANERESTAFQQFTRQLFHTCLELALKPLRQAMTSPITVMCPDGYYRRAIFAIGPYIANYPEQVVLAGGVYGWCTSAVDENGEDDSIVETCPNSQHHRHDDDDHETGASSTFEQDSRVTHWVLDRCTARSTNLDGDPNTIPRSRKLHLLYSDAYDAETLWKQYGIWGDVVPFTFSFPYAGIYDLITPDLLHQLIKGVFKDHLVTFTCKLLLVTHGKVGGRAVIKEIDRRISAGSEYNSIRRFYDGRDYSQWTGDNSKALMRVYVPALVGLVDRKVIQCITAFLEMCYIARKNAITESDLANFETQLTRFHENRTVYLVPGVRDDFNLPRQHALIHMVLAIIRFGALNGLCSSITKSKHIKAVKQP